MEFFRENIIPAEVFVQLIAFLIVFFTLRAFVWNPFLKSLEQRRKRIKDDLEKIAREQADLKRLKSEYDARLEDIREEARKNLQKAVDEGKRISLELQEQARQNAHETLEKAKRDIHLESEKAKTALRAEIATLAMGATEHLVKVKIDEKKDKELVLEVIEELEQIQ